ncbi:hypothetical protein Pint_11476 [Pistacia integerrima]|uniref:Uncharacterized protein n=1 Tax=Pistacia integerrima TaxID=434235 RepID=A0ACC0XJR4_9ROSI|nr:hypothetical protein Pint_11476 [Pistacia integerrima]
MFATPDLKALDISSTQHYRIIANFFWPYFTQKIQFEELKLLYMRQNSLEGTIPSSVCNISFLQDLALAKNFLTGNLPDNVLMLLDLSNNNLEGTILTRDKQAGEAAISRLVEQQSGPIPKRLNGLKMLSTRTRDGNLLGYVISSMYTGIELDMVSKGLLQQLEIVYTYLSGIDLLGNSLTGNIPTKIGLLKGLYILNLSHNQLFVPQVQKVLKLRLPGRRGCFTQL